MSMNDTTADMLTRIRNGIQARRDSVDVIGSRLNRRIAEVLVREGYVNEVHEILDPRGFQALRLQLKYDMDGESVISKIGRVSRPGCRVYAGVRDIPKVLGGLGISVVSTSKGVMSDREARAAGIGGEVLCQVW
ncbi:MAG: 30S ribosomal protein S8 [Planctomycetota bacterium]|nr:30S ribosomal protein S8 [Planctomycetota bacterium]